MHRGLACFSSGVGSAGCYRGLDVGFRAIGCCMFRGQIGVCGDGVALTGFFSWVLSCGGGSGLVKSRGMHESMCSFAGGF